MGQGAPFEVHDNLPEGNCNWGRSKIQLRGSLSGERRANRNNRISHV